MLDLTRITLDAGDHDSREEGVCFMEAVAWWAGETHTDQPECVSPLLAAMGRDLNDALPDETRQRLLPLVPLMAGTADDVLDEARSYMALDWLVRTYVPTWLDLAGLTDHADALRSLAPVVDPQTLQVAYRVVLEVGERVGDEWAEIARGLDTWFAERLAPWGTPRDVAWEVVDSSAWSIARAAVWEAVDSSVWNVTRNVVWNVTRNVVWNVAQNHYGQSSSEVTHAVRAALAPTVVHLQDSAVQLLRAMIRPTA